METSLAKKGFPLVAARYKLKRTSSDVPKLRKI